MANREDHKGNILNDLNLEEHDGLLFAKKASVVSAATIYAVVNTGATGVQNSMVTLNAGPNYVGLTTTTLGVGNTTIGIVRQGTDPWTVSFSGNITLSDAKTYIGLTTTTLGVGNTTIGIVRQGDNPWASNIVGNLTLSNSFGNHLFAKGNLL